MKTFFSVFKGFYAMVFALFVVSCGNAVDSANEKSASKTNAKTTDASQSIIVNNASSGNLSTQSLSNSASGNASRKFVKTKNRCSKCSCSGYWGYKHQNGTYEGNCSNTDKYGHKCGHGPEKHGLRKW